MHDSAICHKPQQYRATCPLEKAHHACMFFVAIIVALTTILVSLCGQRVSIAVPHFCAANGLPYLGFQTSWQNQKRKTMSREFLSRERKRNPNRKWNIGFRCFPQFYSTKLTVVHCSCILFDISSQWVNKHPNVSQVQTACAVLC